MIASDKTPSISFLIEENRYPVHPNSNFVNNIVGTGEVDLQFYLIFRLGLWYPQIQWLKSTYSHLGYYFPMIFP
jgi:hypothetical protein